MPPKKKLPLKVRKESPWKLEHHFAGMRETANPSYPIDPDLSKHTQVTKNKVFDDQINHAFDVARSESVINRYDRPSKKKQVRFTNVDDVVKSITDELPKPKSNLISLDKSAPPDETIQIQSSPKAEYLSRLTTRLSILEQKFNDPTQGLGLLTRLTKQEMKEMNDLKKFHVPKAAKAWKEEVDELASRQTHKELLYAETLSRVADRLTEEANEFSAILQMEQEIKDTLPLAQQEHIYEALLVKSQHADVLETEGEKGLSLQAERPPPNFGPE